MMANSLQSLFQAIAQAQDEQELRQQIMVKVREYFTAQRCRLFFFDELLWAEKKLSDILQRGLSVDHNPVLRYLVERHAAVHDELVLPPGLWKTICPRSDHAHVMVGPIVTNGRLAGGIGLTRDSEASKERLRQHGAKQQSADRNAPAFNAQDLTNLSAICLHVSTRLATIQSQSSRFSLLNQNRLTPREIQIAELVAQGLTNAQIGAALWITENSVKQALKRMFRKLEVSSRAEMVAQLSSNRLFSPREKIL
jgi:DNA-binding CsgD family transcriptional regulator